MTVAVSRANGATTATFSFTKDTTIWTDDPSGGHAHMPTSGSDGWFGSSKTDAAGNNATERIAAYSNIEQASSGATADGGTWSGTFFGLDGADPTGVAGVFDAAVDTTIGGNTVSTTVEGSFGAKR